MCLGNGDICIIRYMKLMLDHYVSRFIRYIQRIGKKQTRLQFQHPNYVCFDAYKACMTLKYFSGVGLSKLHVFLMGNSILPRAEVPRDLDMLRHHCSKYGATPQRRC